jgi:hypothetical protein
MPTVRHPCALDEVPGVVPSDVKVAGVVYDVSEDGTVDLPDDRAVEVLADAYDLAPSDLREQEICGVEMSDGSTCERPAGECPYHD